MSTSKHPYGENPIQEAELGQRDQGLNPLCFAQVELRRVMFELSHNFFSFGLTRCDWLTDMPHKSRMQSS